MSPNETHYAINKLMDTASSISNSVHTIMQLRTMLTFQLDAGDKHSAKATHRDLLGAMSRIYQDLSTATLYLLEMQEEQATVYTRKLMQALKSFNVLTRDYTGICKTLNNYVNNLPIYNQKANATIIGRLMNNVRMGYYPTDLEHVQHFVKSIEFPEGVATNLLDPCCGQGYALRNLAEGNNCYTYGIEIDEERAEQAASILHRVGFGSFYHAKVSDEAFHVLLLNPPYLSLIAEGSSRARSEKKFLVESYKKLMVGGLLIYIIPYYRLTPDICRLICDNFTDITLWKFSESEFSKFNQMAVMGVRRRRKNSAELAAKLSGYAYTPERLPELSRIKENRYKLPAVQKKVTTFKGAVFNMNELAEMFKKSGSVKRQYMPYSEGKSDKKARPPLPLSVGQVGLIGGSGYINGIIECDTPHILKGRVIKEAVSDESVDPRTGNSIITETLSNKMIFNILTTEGIKHLA